ncbi:MAG: radical SAM protein [Proteobacteria bacterium]|nr:radical SAM protein [Pseudomonadota bacterium]MBU1739427.1 radical SAM protein [Pseudomonadota bacterium]
MKIYIEADGCSRRMNEFASLHKYFELNNHDFVNRPDQADFILAGTCAFKGKEEEESIKRIRYLKGMKGKLLVYGCLPDIAPTRYHAEFNGLEFLAPKDIDRIDSYFENNQLKFRDLQPQNIIPEKMKSTSLQSAIGKFKEEFEFSNKFLVKAKDYAGKKIRSSLHLHQEVFYLFICRGCLGKCTYCAIKRAIGPLKSTDGNEIVNQLREGIASGHKKFTILGDDVGAYGKDRNDTFPNLLGHLLKESNGHNESVKPHHNGAIGFHIEEIHPKWMTLYQKEMLELVSTRRIRSILCPIQSGNNRILGLMKREHDARGISAVLSGIRTLHPGIRLKTQIIVGFPSETESEFKQTLTQVDRNRFDEVTVFPYDAKENTPANHIGPRVSAQVISERVEKALAFFKTRKISAHLNCQN